MYNILKIIRHQKKEIYDQKSEKLLEKKEKNIKIEY